MRLIELVEQSQPSKIAAIDERRLNPGFIEAGGPGSGRKAIEDYLKEQGFTKSIVRGTADGNDHQGSSHWSKNIITNPHGINSHSDTLNRVTHTVSVDKDGGWTHSVTGMHGGNNLASLKEVPIHASGNSLDELKQLLAQTCWTGYKRTPGTKKGAKGSCEKIKAMKLKAGGVGSGRHKEALKLANYHEEKGIKYGLDNSAKNHKEASAHFNQAAKHFGSGDISKGEKEFETGKAWARKTNYTHKDGGGRLLKAMKTTKKASQTKIQAPSDLGTEKAVVPDKKGEIVAATRMCSRCGAKLGKDMKGKVCPNCSGKG